MAPQPCLGIFAYPTCVDWSEEQRLRFNNRRTYREKVPSSPPSDLGDLLVVDCATDPILTEPVTSAPPSQPTDSTLTVPAQHTLESLLVGFSTQLSSLTASLRGEKVGARVHVLLHRHRTGHPWPPAPARHCQTTNTCHRSPAVYRTSGTGAAPRLRPTCYSRTSHGTALSASRCSPIAARGAAHVHLHGTHGPSRAAPAPSTWTRSHPAMATVAHAYPAKDGAATPPHGFQITAATQPRGAFSISTATTATVLIAVIFPINPAGATAAIDTVTTVAVATTRTQHGPTRRIRRTTPSHATPAAAMQSPVSTAPPTSPHGAAHRAVPATPPQPQPFFTTFSALTLTLTSESFLLTLQGRTSPLLVM